MTASLHPAPWHMSDLSLPDPFARLLPNPRHLLDPPSPDPLTFNPRTRPRDASLHTLMYTPLQIISFMFAMYALVSFHCQPIPAR
jgi:hypothetical protein